MYTSHWPQLMTAVASPGEDISQRAPEASLRYLKELTCAYLCIGHSHDHFGAIFGNATSLVLLPHHEAVDVLQEDQGHPPLRAQLDEMGSYSSNSSSKLADHLLPKLHKNISTFSCLLPRRHSPNLTHPSDLMTSSNFGMVSVLQAASCVQP